MATDGFALLCAGAGLVGVANAFVHQYRFAAIESSPPSAAGHAVSLVLVGSLGGAFVGPMLAARGEDWIADAPFAGCFLALAAAALAVAVAVARLRPLAAREDAAAEPPRPLTAIARQPLFLAAVIGGAAGYGVMIFVMTATPLSMHALDGHSLDSAAQVVQAHVVAMYLPSLVTGYLIGRWGVGRLMAVGVCALAITLALAFAGREVLHYGASMVALGVGWNFLFVGGTVFARPRPPHGGALPSASRQRLQRVRHVRRRFPERRPGAARLGLARRALGGHAAHRHRDGHIGRGAPGALAKRPSGDSALNALGSAVLTLATTACGVALTEREREPRRRCRQRNVPLNCAGLLTLSRANSLAAYTVLQASSQYRR